ncbi:WW domain-containing oxidoreductase [Aphelenchoides fujianensis]|nr:WW domain-containing oxidoreductase [Aphelenchoides fujianensis]
MSAENAQSLAEPQYHKRFTRRTTALEVLDGLDLSDKTVLITGTTAGIGLETARAAALKGARVFMANRSITKAEGVRDAIYKETEHRKIELIHMDLSSLQSVQAAAEEFLKSGSPLHVLILNAGIMSPTSPNGTIDGYEATFATNQLGHFYLTRLLRSKLVESAPFARGGRLVALAQGGLESEEDYSFRLLQHTFISPTAPLEEKMQKLVPAPGGKQPGYLLYALSKLCNVLWAFKLHRELNDQGVGVYVLHPGSFIPTSIGRSYGVFGRLANAVVKPFAKTPEQGAATTVYCAFHPDVEKLQAPLARDEQLQDALWERCNEYVEKYESTRTPAN